MCREQKEEMLWIRWIAAHFVQMCLIEMPKLKLWIVRIKVVWEPKIGLKVPYEPKIIHILQEFQYGNGVLQTTTNNIMAELVYGSRLTEAP